MDPPKRMLGTKVAVILLGPPSASTLLFRPPKQHLGSSRLYNDEEPWMSVGEWLRRQELDSTATRCKMGQVHQCFRQLCELMHKWKKWAPCVLI
jgi:hypothetical protein